MAEIFKFPAVEQILDPLQLYLTVYPALLKRDKLYISGAVTSAGGRRLYPHDIPAAISANTAMAHKVINVLAGTHQLDYVQTVVSPYELGKRSLLPARTEQPRPWRERDYLTFWLMVIAGMSDALATTFFWNTLPDTLSPKINREIAIFNDYQAPVDQRRVYYRQMADVAVNTINGGRDHEPMMSLLQLPAALESLGCWLESVVATRLNIPVVAIEFFPEHPAWPHSELAQDEVVQMLAQDQPSRYFNHSEASQEDPLVQVCWVEPSPAASVTKRVASR